MTEGKTVSVPEPFRPLFDSAERYVSEYFDTLHRAPEQGVITISGERYILVRAASMSIHFMDFISAMYPGMDEQESFAVVSRLLYDLAAAIGESDARNFHDKMGVDDPIAKLSTGPIHFAHSGWAFVDIKPESNPSPDEAYYLLYDHPQSFESDSWIAAGKQTDQCVCHMNAGYSSGWCTASFGLQLAGREITCRARGDAQCRFIMAVPERLDEHVDRYRAAHG